MADWSGVSVEIYYSSESIDSKMMFGYFSKVARLVVGVKNIKMPLLLKASRKDRICLD